MMYTTTYFLNLPLPVKYHFVSNLLTICFDFKLRIEEGVEDVPSHSYAYTSMYDSNLIKWKQSIKINFDEAV